MVAIAVEVKGLGDPFCLSPLGRAIVLKIKIKIVVIAPLKSC
jgi:hypothetical protein